MKMEVILRDFSLIYSNLSLYELFRLEGFNKSMLTPIVKVTKGKNVKSFYNLSDYEKWKEKDLKGWSVKYYKGLGTSTPKESFQGIFQRNEDC